jgi:5-methylcytosine-specific restriction endonuclease McrA
MDRTKNDCAFCMSSIRASVPALRYAGDHIFPVSKGGSNELENFQPLHRFCNAAKSSLSGGHIPQAFLMGRWFGRKLIDDSSPAWRKHALKWATAQLG